MRGGTISALLAIICALCLPAQASPQELHLTDSAPAEISQELSRFLGTPVEITGAAGRRLSLSVTTPDPQAALDKVAAGLQGTWRARLVVRPGAMDRPGQLPGWDHSLPLSLDGVAASRAFGMVARLLRLDLDLADGLERKVSVPPGRLDASALLDRIAQQAGARWTLVYRIFAPDAPPPPLAVRREPPTAPPAETVVRVQPSAPTPMARVDFRAVLWEHVHRLVRASPAERSAAVQAFVQEAQRLLAELDRLPAAERAQHLRSLQNVRLQWRRLYTGLAPNVQAELAPVHELLEQRLRG
jgi:hypothetical protein